MAAESLNLVGDGDEVDLIEELEAIFGVAVAEEDAPHWRTLGDVARSFETRLPLEDREADAWAIQRAFYRIRGAIAAERVRPSTPLASFAGRPRELHARIAQASGLALPALQPTRIGRAAGIAEFLALVGLAVAAFNGNMAAVTVSAAAGAAALLWLALLEPYRFPAGIGTVGDLARTAAPLNLPKLREEDAGRGIVIWDVVAAVAAEHAFIAPVDVGRETLLFPRR